MVAPPSLLTARTRPAIRALALAIVPETAGLDERGWESFERHFEAGVPDRPAVVRQIRAFLSLLGFLARLRFGQALPALGPAETARLLDGLAVSRILLLRRGVWGVRTLVFLGYYGDESRAAALGYRASPAGWSAR